MQELAAQSIYCPYCGESIEVLIDASELDQRYIEDCQVCCRPIDFSVYLDESDELRVRVSHENE